MSDAATICIQDPGREYESPAQPAPALPFLLLCVFAARADPATD